MATKRGDQDIFLWRDCDNRAYAWTCFMGLDRIVQPLDYVKIEHLPTWLRERIANERKPEAAR